MLQQTSEVMYLVGPPGAGKSALGDHLQTIGYGSHFPVSDLLRQLVPADHGRAARLGECADAMVERFGPLIWRELGIEYAGYQEQPHRRVLVNGPRRIREIDAALNNRVDVLFVDADEQVCAERLAQQAARTGRAFNETAFLMRSRQERTGTTSGGKHGIYVNGIRAMGGLLIVGNNVDIPALRWADNTRQNSKLFPQRRIQMLRRAIGL